MNCMTLNIDFKTFCPYFYFTIFSIVLSIPIRVTFVFVYFSFTSARAMVRSTEGDELSFYPSKK